MMASDRLLNFQLTSMQSQSVELSLGFAFVP